MQRKRRGPEFRSQGIYEIGGGKVREAAVARSTTSGSEKERRNPYGSGSGMVFEMDAARGVELPARADPKEMHVESIGDDKKWLGFFK